MQLPEDFIENIKAKLSNAAYSNFLNALDEPSPTSIRIHPIKYHLPKPNEPVKWCSLGYYLKERPKFTLDPSFHAGAYYVQEASSMIIWQVLHQINPLNNKLNILDLCAAPGGKSSLIASYLNNEGLLVCNEVIKNRSYTLRQNITKEGYSNIIISNNDPKDFSQLIDFFDVILIDAPCSGEGMFRKDQCSITEWSNDNVQISCARQKIIIADVFPSLKPGGHIIYSTCTYNEKENIQNMHWVTTNFDVVSLPLVMKDDWKTIKIEHSGAIGYQFYPHLLSGEGFFVSILQKQEMTHHSKNKRLRLHEKNLLTTDKKHVSVLSAWVISENKSFLTDKTGSIHLINENLNEDARILSNYLRLIYCGVTLGTVIRDVFVPDHSLALSLNILKPVSTIELSLKDALMYLKKDLMSIENADKSWVLITYKGNGLGWIKNLGNRINNYLPNENKIMMNIDFKSLQN